MSETVQAGQRLDIWLWYARFFKTRARATSYVSGKGVRISRAGQTRRTDKPGTRVQSGDVLTFYQARVIRVMQVQALGDRRGPAEEARALYTLMSVET